jgi:hypothetical protein
MSILRSTLLASAFSLATMVAPALASTGADGTGTALRTADAAVTTAASKDGVLVLAKRDGGSGSSGSGSSGSGSGSSGSGSSRSGGSDDGGSRSGSGEGGSRSGGTDDGAGHDAAGHDAGDDHGTHAEAGDDKGGLRTAAEPGDDRGMGMEPGDDHGVHNASIPETHKKRRKGKTAEPLL